MGEEGPVLAGGASGGTAGEEARVRLFVLHAGECDRKKCTALKLVRFGMAALIGGSGQRAGSRRGGFPPGALLLDPFAPELLSPADRPLAERKGLLALDCSWDLAEPRRFHSLLRGRRTRPRSLPCLLAANPVKFGQPRRLSTLEALAAALIILGKGRQAEGILGLYTWGPRFLEVNRLPLREYASAPDEPAVRRAQDEFFEEE